MKNQEHPDVQSYIEYYAWYNHELDELYKKIEGGMPTKQAKVELQNIVNKYTEFQNKVHYEILPHGKQTDTPNNARLMTAMLENQSIREKIEKTFNE